VTEKPPNANPERAELIYTAGHPSAFADVRTSKRGNRVTGIIDEDDEYG
jgi:hypothetical protein